MSWSRVAGWQQGGSAVGVRTPALDWLCTLPGIVSAPTRHQGYGLAAQA